jgi:citrate lyase subunit beta/citryl-CoA lyase
MSANAAPRNDKWPLVMRSLLFVPADSERKLAKGLASGADALIIDLEDSIVAERKAAARDAATEFLRAARSRTNGPRLLVRVNGLDTGLIDADLAAVVAARPDAIVLPKAEGGASVVHLDAKLNAQEALACLAEGSIRIVAVAETGASLFSFGSYGGASKRLSALTFGGEDLARDLGAQTNRDAAGYYLDAFRLARALSLAGAAAAGVAAIDGICTDFRNDTLLRREAEEAARDGFSSKVAIHPGQVAIINEAFTPSAESIARARAIVAAFAVSPQAGALAIDGVMYDRPHLVRAQQLLASVK